MNIKELFESGKKMSDIFEWVDHNTIKFDGKNWPVIDSEEGVYFETDQRIFYVNQSLANRPK